MLAYWARPRWYFCRGDGGQGQESGSQTRRFDCRRRSRSREGNLVSGRGEMSWPWVQSGWTSPFRQLLRAMIGPMMGDYSSRIAGFRLEAESCGTAIARRPHLCWCLGERWFFDQLLTSSLLWYVRFDEGMGNGLTWGVAGDARIICEDKGRPQLQKRDVEIGLGQSYEMRRLVSCEATRQQEFRKRS